MWGRAISLPILQFLKIVRVTKKYSANGILGKLALGGNWALILAEIRVIYVGRQP